ncbi:MAG: GNAT family N-acetyltransferase [Litorimonas sp.]
MTTSADLGVFVGQSRQNIIKSVTDLTAQDWAAWTDMRKGNPALISPYFHPDYVRKIAAVNAGSPIHIICAYKDEENIGFLAVQGGNFARPAGAPLSDFHGIIQAKDTQLNFSDILKDTGISAYHFSAAVGVDDLADNQVIKRERTAALDLTTTAQDWRDGLDSSYRRHMKSTRRRIRKAEESIGPRRFVFNSDDPKVFEHLMAWKFKKFEDTGKYNVLSVDWTMALIRELWETPTQNGLRCDLHALYLGERLAAVDLGLSDGPVFHSWIVAYDHEFQNFAPGIQLLEGLIDEAVALGYSRIDMGAGLDGYKRHYATHGHDVTGGFIPVKGIGASTAKLYGKAELWGQGSASDMPGKIRRRYTQISACDTNRINQVKALISAVQTRGKS